MSDWISVDEKMPKEHPTRTDWFNIKKGDREIPYPVTFWENDKGGSFVNAGFEKESGVTHWREKQ
jgi:hypothetical protein